MNLLKSILFVFLFFYAFNSSLKAQCVASFTYSTNGTTCDFTSILHTGFANPTYSWLISDVVNNTQTTLSGANPSHTFSGIPPNGSGLSHSVQLTVTDGTSGCQHHYTNMIDLATGNTTLWFDYIEGSGMNSGNMELTPHSTGFPTGSFYFWKFHYPNGAEVYTTDINPIIDLNTGSNYAELTVVGPGNSNLRTYYGEIYVPSSNVNVCLQNEYLLEITLGAKSPQGTMKGEIRDVNNVAIADFSFESSIYNDPTIKRYFCLPDGCYTVYIEEEENAGTTLYSGTSYSFKNINNNTILASGSRANASTPLMIDTVPFCGTQAGTNCLGVIDFTSTAGTGNTTFFQPVVSGYSINRQYNWTFDNGTSSTARIATAALTNGWHQVCLTVSEANCLTSYCDSIFVNNTSNSCTNNSMTLFIDLDNYAAETSWEITDGTGVVLDSDAYTNADDNGIIAHNLCLPTGCYELKFYDRHGDGICCQYGDGYYTLIDHITGTLVSSDGLFGHSESTSFCVGGASTPCGEFNMGYFTHEVDSSGGLLFTTEMPLNHYPLNFTWDFGNGNTSTLANPSFTFSTNGYHEVCLTADSMGCTFTYCDSIMVTTNGAMSTGPCPNLRANLNITQDPNNPFLLVMQPLINNALPNAQFQFVWNFGDATAPLSGLPSHNYKDYGSYVVCLLALDTINGCTATFCDTISLDSFGNFSRNFTKVDFSVNTIAPIIYTGLGEVKEAIKSLYLFPNPAQDVLNLVLSSREKINGEITIIDVTGKAVYTQRLDQHFKEESITISVRKLPAGVYFLKMTYDDKQVVRKFIKK